MDRTDLKTERSFAQGGIILQDDGLVAQITLNNPKRLNALRLDMWRALAELTDELKASKTRAVILTGAGERAFSAGADISEFPEVRSTKADVASYNRTVARALDGLAALPMPVIAAIQGHCIGGGLEIALRCDLRFAGNGATFAFTPAKLGLAVGADEVGALARIAGPAATAELLFTAQSVSAERAEQWGLVNRIIASEALSTEVTRIAEVIAANAPLTLRAVKAGLAAHAKPCDPEAVAAAHRMVEACYASTDYQEGQAAFAEKRRADFKGH